MGSEWRKWDLHVHAPGTKLSDGYTHDNDELEEFCKAIESSDVTVIGIADYFSADGYYRVSEKFYEMYPESEKILLPNIELRLNESVNAAQEEVNTHILFPPESARTIIDNFLSHLNTQITDGDGRNKKCSELSGSEFKSATVSRMDIENAKVEAFGKDCVRQDKFLIVTAGNNDGIRPRRGSFRKANISDQIDKFSDAYFGSSGNRDYFLDVDRLEDDDQTIKAKPTFSCCDAHTFDDLGKGLGRSSEEEGSSYEVCWIKADPTYEGLLQTLVEPDERVIIQDLKPDAKEPYKVIKEIKFTGTNDFPNSIALNTNLVSIIGSRSSGKSALLAYIAHSINPEDAISRQMDALETQDRNVVGPAAGKTWASVARINCEVIWGTGQSANGKVVYIPQNYLYSISKRPEEITKRIEPVLFSNYPTLETAFDKCISQVETSTSIIETEVQNWFEYGRQIVNLKSKIDDYGEKKSIEQTKRDYSARIDELKKTLDISEAEIEQYRKVTEQVSVDKAKLESVRSKKALVSRFIKSGDEIEVVDLDVSISFYPSISGLPTDLVDEIETTSSQSGTKIADSTKDMIKKKYLALEKSENELDKTIKDTLEEHKELFIRNRKSNELADLVEKSNKQDAILKLMSNHEESIEGYNQKKTKSIEILNGEILNRSEAHLALSQSFASAVQDQTEMKFGVEIDFDQDSISELSDLYNRQHTSPYIVGSIVNVKKARTSVETYLEHMLNSQRLRVNQSNMEVAKKTLSEAEDIRFTATLEGDKIGGFSLSTMTPGKQALFALTLILDESDDAWPLLIDQPEDDLDSRSIYDYIVPYLKERKRERQVIMVSHNANLVVGSDSEQLIVANRHGVDRRNRDNRTFDYLTGALEDTMPKSKSKYVLETGGIREHAIDILDGGKEAFEKRKNKYKI